MDMQTCDVCGKEFDFDKSGLASESYRVCNVGCAKKAAAARGHDYMIHDHTGQVTETNVPGVIVLPRLGKRQVKR